MRPNPCRVQMTTAGTVIRVLAVGLGVGVVYRGLTLDSFIFTEQ